MVVNNEGEKNKISVGLIINEDQLKGSVFPQEVIAEIEKTPYYLLIFISREDVVKISCFPSKTNNLKKILIKLKEFSPDLVKGISGVLKELNISKDILHTTGLCYEQSECFYETYLIAESDNFNAESIVEKFKAIPKITSVVIEEINSL